MPFGKAKHADASVHQRRSVDFSDVLDLLQRTGALTHPRDSSPGTMATFVQGYHEAHGMLDKMLWSSGGDTRRQSAIHRSRERA